MKTNKWIEGCLAAFIAIVSPAAVSAQGVPASVSFTSRLTDAAGEPISGPVRLRIAIYDAPSGGARVWEEDEVSVDADAAGVLVHELGHQPASEPLDATVFAGQPLYMDVTIEDEVLAPRVPILSVPYALRASVAVTAENALTSEKLGDLAPADVALAGHDHDAQYLKLGVARCPAGQFAVGLMDNGGVPALMCEAPTPYTAGTGLSLVSNQFSIAASGVTSAQILDDTITGADIAASAVGASEIATGAVGSAEIADGTIASADIATDALTAGDIASNAIGNAELANDAVQPANLAGGGVAVYYQNPGCALLGRAANVALALGPRCETQQCGTEYYACVSASLQAPCNQANRATCDNTLMGYLVAP